MNISYETAHAICVAYGEIKAGETILETLKELQKKYEPLELRDGFGRCRGLQLEYRVQLTATAFLALNRGWQWRSSRLTSDSEMAAVNLAWGRSAAREGIMRHPIQLEITAKHLVFHEKTFVVECLECGEKLQLDGVVICRFSKEGAIGLIEHIAKTQVLPFIEEHVVCGDERSLTA